MQPGRTCCKALACLLLADIGLGDGFVEGREEVLEERVVFTEEARLCDASRIEGGEDNTRFVVISAVQLLHKHHITDLAVLVRLRTIELMGIKHGHRRLHALFQTLEVPHMCNWGNHASQLRTVHGGRDRPKDDATCRLHRAALQVLEGLLL